ncbi:hypothetical protein N9H69_02510 [Flavobacteriaceae bacterium]|nr:hypothetical protein [Flavobacteriaceae bacterium]MDA9015536.1 hypothetical protein [Flavobacteriaceae bacterium]MDB3862410.1 hypothetical protein [Flavobacteriaceae bacterium]MDC3354379.1 hypothetical protein [Flavobacteriaceae bacterium]
MNPLLNYKQFVWIGLLQWCFLFGLTTLSAQNATPEASIHAAYIQDKTAGNQNNLKRINQELDSIFQAGDNRFNRYWLSYGLYNWAILAGIQEEKEQAELLVDQTIGLLSPLKEDAESLALLSLAQGFSTQFKSYLDLMRIGRNAVLNAQRAAVLDPNSLRANLAVALNNFYTPKAFGGGKLTLQYLMRAMEETTVNSQERIPRWGKPIVYELLVKYYRKNEQNSIALDYLTQGLEEFPNNELLQGLK